MRAPSHFILLLVVIGSVSVDAICMEPEKVQSRFGGTCTLDQCIEGPRSCSYICDTSCCSQRVGNACGTTRGNVPDTDPVCPNEPPARDAGCDGDLECKYRQDLYCPPGATPSGRRLVVTEDLDTCVYSQGYSCLDATWTMWAAGSPDSTYVSVGDGSADDVCSADLACKEGLSCCAWDNEANAKANTGRCGEMCTQGEVGVEPENGSEGDSCSADLACEEGLTCCTAWDDEGNAKADEGACGQMCTQGEFGVEPEKPKGSIGDSCSAELTCKEGLSCCNWDNEAEAEADTGVCGEVCTQGEVGEPVEKPCVPCPTRRRRAVLFSAVVDEEECCP